MTEPWFNPQKLRDEQDECVFERLGFSHFYRTNPSLLALVHQQHASKGEFGMVASLVVDSGYSFSHCTPFQQLTPIASGIRRVPVGGKLLTNYLKELLSFRHYNLLDETHLVTGIKEQLCMVSTNFLHDLEQSRHQRVSPHAMIQQRMRESSAEYKQQNTEELVRRWIPRSVFSSSTPTFLSTL